VIHLNGVNLEIRDVDMAFPLHLFILRGEDIYVEDGCCPFKIVFDEDFYVHFMCIFVLL